jgi:hypothetical protein
MEAEGFSDVSYELFLGGVTELHVGTKSVKSEK